MSSASSIDIVLPVYNGEEYLATSLDSVAKFKEQANSLVNITVVNDGSTDNSADLIQTNYKFINLINLVENVGRSKSRNKGAWSCNADIIVFVDSDCSLDSSVNADLINRHFNQGYDLCFGRVKTKSAGFWGKYLDNVAEKRHELAKHNHFLSFTSQIFAIKRSTLENIQGFNENYIHYGFEDRDLFLRILKSNAKILYVPELIATTIDTIKLDDICTKMELSAKYSAKIFYTDHPEEYRTMVYGKIDSRIHPFTTLPIKLFNILFLSFFRILGTKALSWKFCPYQVKHYIVKFISALYYVKGTYSNS